MSAIELDGDQLAALCFTRVPPDVVPRDVVLAALWQLCVRAARLGFDTHPDRTFLHTLLGERSGLARAAFRTAVADLERDGLIFKDRNGYGLTKRKGFAAVREVVDVDKRITVAKAAA